MTTTNISSIAGFVAGDNTAGSGNPGNTPSNITNINNFIAAMAPGDELIFDKPFISNATIVIQNKLGCRFHGASPYGARITPNGNFDAVRYEDNEYCIFEGYGVWPKHTQTAGIGHKIIEGGAAGSGAGVNNKYRDLVCADRTRQQARWGLGTGRPYKGFEVSGIAGGYNGMLEQCQAQGCVSDGISVGVYGQSTRGTVGFTFSKTIAAHCGGQGWAVFCSEALGLVDGCEALGNMGNGLLTYPDNGGTVELFIDRGSFDTNWGNGTLLQAGGAGAGGRVVNFVAHNTWWANNGNPDADGQQGGAWNLVHGFAIDTAQVSRIKEVRLIDNRSVVNGLCGYVLGAYERLDIEGNVAQDNSQWGAGGAWGMIFATPIPLANSILGNTCDGTAMAPYPGGMQAGFAITGAAGNVYAEGNASFGNFPGFNYSMAVVPVPFVGGAVQNNN